MLLYCVKVLLRYCDVLEGSAVTPPSLSPSRQRFTPVGGSTELWRPLRALGLLPPSRGVRNLLLLSDGHIQNPELTLQLLRDGVQHSRLFACGLRSARLLSDLAAPPLCVAMLTGLLCSLSQSHSQPPHAEGAGPGRGRSLRVLRRKN